MKFEIGEVVILNPTSSLLKFKGCETTILDIEIDNGRPLYVTDLMDTGMIGWWEERLRKKKPPQELSSWEQVQKDTGWNPQKVEA